MDDITLSVSDFVAVFNQTIAYAYPSVIIEGELDSFRISKNRWVYFNLKDDHSSVKFFGTTSQLPGPLEDGLLLKVKGTPYLHPLYGFSINVSFMQPVGEGSLKKAQQLLELKLTKEGLFEESRKRPIMVPPHKIGLITSVGSAAYHDFIKITGERWGGMDIQVYDVQVQGEKAYTQIVSALNYFNAAEQLVDVVVLIRGGGSADDLAAFNSEVVTRAVATSRIPTLVAIGHEVDVSLAEMAADKRGSTPTHSAEILTLDKKRLIADLQGLRTEIYRLSMDNLKNKLAEVNDVKQELNGAVDTYLSGLKSSLEQSGRLLGLLSPLSALNRGYALIRKSGHIIMSGKSLSVGDNVDIELQDASLAMDVRDIKLKKI